MSPMIDLGVDYSDVQNEDIFTPLPNGTYDFTVNWGDGQSDVITSPTQPEITHAYSGAGARTITITPNTAYSVDHWSFGRRSSSIPSEALTDIFSFGDIKFYANEDIFYSCFN